MAAHTITSSPANPLLQSLQHDALPWAMEQISNYLTGRPLAGAWIWQPERERGWY
uniref:Uncharacterized protein n=1 Tax=Oryza sativa subsp. japonica TaxID=39947 RepID=Q6YTA3_ORYSJ|nr:hypothetical protein [Oryza sativa Japonica Group]BAC99954.1 hypothetical protein [Oryza sativa Japonica Group]